LFQPPNQPAQGKTQHQHQGQGDPGQQLQPPPRLTCDPSHSFPRPQ
jgi:hypothetical protein